MKLIKTRDFLIIAGLAIVGLILGGIFDYEVTDSLYNSINMQAFGVIVSNYAIVPFFLTTCTLCGVGIITALKKPKKLSIPVIIVLSLAILFVLYQEFDKIKDMNEFYGSIGGYINLAFCFLLTISGSIFLSLKIAKKYDQEKLFQLALMAGVTIITAFIIMVGLKFLASRPRPWYIFGEEYMKVGPHYNEFRQFYEFHPFEALKDAEHREFFKSFPSNHVNTALMAMPAVLFFSKIEPKLQGEKMKVILTYSFLGLGLLVAFTRLIAGAHFLSDVSFGLLVPFLITYVAGQLFDYVNVKKQYLVLE